VARKLIAGIALGLTAALITLFLAWTGALDKAELATYDWRVSSTANPASINKDIVLVEINDTSIRDLEPLVGRWPWPRAAFAAVIDFLARSPARVIGVDLGWWEADRSPGVRIGESVIAAAESDAALNESIRNGPPTVLLANSRYYGVQGELANAPADWRPRAWPFQLGPAIEERPTIVPPFEPLLSSATLVGHDFVPFDTDSVIRRVPPFLRHGDKYMPQFAVAVALVAGGYKGSDVALAGGDLVIRDRRIPLVPLRVQNVDNPSLHHDQLTMLINYQAPPLVAGERPYRSYEARLLIASEGDIASGRTPTLDPAVFKDKIVLVGLSSSGLVDVFGTPFGADKGTMPGIQLHASIVDSVLSNRFIRPASHATRMALVIAAGLLVGLLAALLSFSPAAAGTLLAVGLWTWYAVSAFKGGLWLNMSQPLLAMATALFAGTTYQYFVEGREKRIVKTLFGRYVSRDVYKQLLEHPELAELGGKRRDMTVLFSDIRGFTAVTEKGEPDALVAQLNEYFSKMVDVVFRHHGTVDKFVGDMVMALFGAPVDDADHAEHAVAAAVDMVGELAELNRKWAAEGKAQLDIGVGVNSGDMIAGNIGSSSIMSYTVIGDNVNLGSRLESLNKDYRTRIIISGATRDRIRGTYTVRPLGDVVVKGKTVPVAIFEVIVPSPLTQVQEELHP
jgi:adenylate cyclase